MSTEKLRKMHPVNHPAKSHITPKSWIPCQIQQLHPTAARQIWWAKAVEDPIPSWTQQMMAKIQAKADKWLKIEPTARDACAVSPWLLANKWHLYIFSCSCIHHPTVYSILSHVPSKNILCIAKHFWQALISLCCSISILQTHQKGKQGTDQTTVILTQLDKETLPLQH